jgi:glutathione S-transferase
MANQRRWLSVDEARGRAGLRLVLSLGVPGPWGEGAKGLLTAKGLEFECVVQDPGGPNPELRAWTGEINAPQLLWNDEPALDRWCDLIFLAERLAPEPSLLPADAADRALMLGLCHELCGEHGFGWSRRLMLFSPIMSLPVEPPNAVREMVAPMALRYGWTPEATEAAPARAAEILALFGRQLAEQRAAGRSYLVGDALSAVDIYWAAFAALVEPLSQDLCAMPGHLRTGYAQRHPLIDAVLDPALLEHRDFVYEQHLELPLDLGPSG